MELTEMDIKNKKTIKLVTHDGSFHSDDIFATAALFIMLGKKEENFEIIRTRDPEIINKGDYVFDVGGIYDEKTNRFDHHQKGGAGKRSNNIEYSSFGLIWKKFGKEISGSEKEAELVEKRLVAPIDADDNGFDLVENKYDISPYFIQHFFYSMRPTWSETDLSQDEMFFKCVKIAKEVLLREIIQARDSVLAEEKVVLIYQNTKDKRIIILDENYSYEDILTDFLEPLFVVYPRKSDNSWGMRAMRKSTKIFENRKNLPKSWAGLRDEELQKITGVKDAIFCHKALFMAVAKTKEGAVKLAELALSV